MRMQCTVAATSSVLLIHALVTVSPCVRLLRVQPVVIPDRPNTSLADATSSTPVECASCMDFGHAWCQGESGACHERLPGKKLPSCKAGPKPGAYVLGEGDNNEKGMCSYLTNDLDDADRQCMRHTDCG